MKRKIRQTNFCHNIYYWTKRIPKGKVATYGLIAYLAGNVYAARIVGWALHILSDEELKKIPWYRVVNKEGRISTTCLKHNKLLQKKLLEKEGIKVKIKKNNFYIDLKKYLWLPKMKDNITKRV